MNRNGIKQYIEQTYRTGAEFPWAKYPTYAVFRHPDNRKWFAVVMRVPRKVLGLPDGGETDILNVKCDPTAVSQFLSEPGFLPAYHMNKTHWITVLTEDSVPEETLRMLIAMSFSLTAERSDRPKI